MPGGLAKLLQSIVREPATSNDQLTDDEAVASRKAKQTSLLQDLTQLTAKNAYTIAQALATFSSGEPINDRDLLLEHSVSMLQSLPPNSSMGTGITNTLIGALWRDLPHPPGAVCGEEARYRSGDGSGNNLWNPEMGKAGSPYSRSVPPLAPKPPNLPDPEMVYEQLLRRRDATFREHPSGLNRMFFSLATVVVHEIFQSNHARPWINETSSYVDLSTVYGNTQEDQDRVRTFEQGLLYPDTIASDRIMMMPPGVVAICIMFSRFHNFAAKRIYEINESDKYKDPKVATVEELKWQDEDIFQLARNVTVAHFASTVLRDYVSAILNTVRANTDWHLELGAEIRNRDGTRMERGTGNVVSAEFNVLYRWHAPLSHSDDKWMENVFTKAWPDKPMDEVTSDDFWQYLIQRQDDFKTIPPYEWTFGGLQRNQYGYFNDSELGKLIKDLVEEPGHAFGARSTPGSMKLVDISGISMARKVFNVCTLNEFRKYLHLKEYKSFLEWNPDAEVAKAAEKLYGHIDNLELYPGLMAEETKPAMPGSGLCPGQTTGRGILDDAVALIRGDRLLTYDLNSSTLTHWGVAQLHGSPGAYGGILSKVMFTVLPNAFTGTSPYALLPFYTPKVVKEILKKNGVVEKYDLVRPPDDRPIQAIYSHEGCKKAFLDTGDFAVPYHKEICSLSKNNHFLLCTDDRGWHDQRARVLAEAFFNKGFEEQVAEYFGRIVPELIHQRSLSFSSSDRRRQIDIVRDVCNVAPIMWIADRFAIPLKTTEHPRGVISSPELFGALLVLFVYTSFNIIPHASWKLREAAMEVAPVLANVIAGQVRSQSSTIEPLIDWFAKGTAYEVKPEAERYYTTLQDYKLSTDEIVYSSVNIMGAIAGNLTQQASLLIDFYLTDDCAQEGKRIQELAALDTESANQELHGYVLEGMRLAGVVPGLPRNATRDFVFQDGERQIELRKGQKVLIAISKASMDPKVFADPEKVDPHRPRNSYLLLGHGLHYCFGARLVGSCLTAMLKQVFKLKNIRRAPGSLGKLTSFQDEIAGVPLRLYLDHNCGESPIPSSMVVEYDLETSLVAREEAKVAVGGVTSSNGYATDS